MWNLKYGTNEPICKTETDSKKTGLWLPRWGGGEGEGSTEGLGLHMQAIAFRMNKQQSPTIQHRALYGIIL